MSTGFDNWFNVALSASPSITNYKETESLVDAKLAAAIERDIRTTIDPGMYKDAAAAAEGVRVKAAEGGFTIYAKSHDDVLRATSKQVSKESPASIKASGVEDLFEQSSGVPQAETNPDGTTKLVYKTISIDALFSEQKEAAQKFAVDQAVTESVRMNIGKAYNEAAAEVERKHPGEK